MTTARPLSLPGSPDELTPAFLSAALAASLPGVEVAKLEIVEAFREAL